MVNMMTKVLIWTAAWLFLHPETVSADNDLPALSQPHDLPIIHMRMVVLDDEVDVSDFKQQLLDSTEAYLREATTGDEHSRWETIQLSCDTISSAFLGDEDYQEFEIELGLPATLVYATLSGNVVFSMDVNAEPSVETPQQQIHEAIHSALQDNTMLLLEWYETYGDAALQEVAVLHVFVEPQETIREGSGLVLSDEENEYDASRSFAKDQREFRIFVTSLAWVIVMSITICVVAGVLHFYTMLNDNTFDKDMHKSELNKGESLSIKSKTVDSETNVFMDDEDDIETIRMPKNCFSAIKTSKPAVGFTKEEAEELKNEWRCKLARFARHQRTSKGSSPTVVVFEC